MAIINMLTPYRLTSLWPISKYNPKFCSSSGSGRKVAISNPCPAMHGFTMAAQKLSEKKLTRRSGNYQPSLWEFDYIQSLNNGYEEEKYVRRANELKARVKMMLEEEMNMLCCLELIDNLLRLGLSYHFEDEIKRTLSWIYDASSKICSTNDGDLYTTALKFKLLRQHGFNVSQEIFDCFKNEDGEFKQNLAEDAKGLLYLYEASFESTEGETTLDLARDFAIRHLKNSLDNGNIDQNLALLVHHALELPLRWRVPRIEARWYIDLCQKNPEMNLILLEFAKLDFNIVQAAHQEDLRHVSSWWKRTGLAEKLPFIRDRVVENFFWTIGVTFQPQYGECRRTLGKVCVLITTIDDIYDVYGTLEELELFTNAIERWDVKAMDQLPDYLRAIYLAFFNSINEMAYDALKEQDVHIVQYLTKVWADLCKAYLQEAKWYYSGYTPTMEEYLNNAWISISVPVMSMHVYAVITNPIEKDALDCMDSHKIVYWSSVLLRLADDLGTSPGEMKRGDVPKSVQCYMKETGCSEEEAREYVWFLLGETWKKMNKDILADSPFSRTFIRAAENFARMALAMYQYGDGHGLNSNPVAQDRIKALLFSPVSLS